MVISSTEKLRAFLETIGTIGFFQRLFGWNTVRRVSAVAYTEFKMVISEFNSINEQLTQNQSEIKILNNDLKNLKETNFEFRKNMEILIGKYEDLNKNYDTIEKELLSFKETENLRQEQYEHKITELNSLKEQLDNDRKELQSLREKEIQSHFEEMKRIWINHELMVEEMIKAICSRHQIEYFNKEKVPFKGKPDNSIRICDEFIIFDAKSPSSDDLSNFSTYIRTQAEAVRKYIKEDEVHKSVFLVIPSNTVGVIDQFYYNMGDYSVYIVTIDALEPIILSLKQIENYEFAEQLSPEERDNICRIIGKFAHATKRRMQIDSYFCNEYINILNNCTLLTNDMLEKTIEFEKSTKMNPPMEKRVKAIPLKQLERDIQKIKQQIEAQDINASIPDELIDALPLYKEKEKKIHDSDDLSKQ